MKLSIWLIILCFPFAISAQSNLSVEFLSGGFKSEVIETPGSSSYQIQFDYVFEPGILLSYQLYSDAARYSIKFFQGMYQNSAASTSGFTSVMLKYEIYQYYKHNWNIGIGPTLHYSPVSAGIIDQPLFQLNDTKFKAAWLTAEFEYNIYVARKLDFSLSISNVASKSIGVVGGFRYWISKTSKKSCNCPGSKTKVRK